MYDCNCINTPFHDFESLEFAPKEKHAMVNLWRVEVVYKNGVVLVVPQTASEIELCIQALHLRLHQDVLKVSYSKVDVQKII